MAVSPLDTSELIAQQVVLYEWLAIVAGDTGAPIQVENFADFTVTIDGTFGDATVTLKGSIDGTTYHTLTDPQGNAISLTSAGMESTTELARYIRPEVADGDETTAIDVRLVARRGIR